MANSNEEGVPPATNKGRKAYLKLKVVGDQMTEVIEKLTEIEDFLKTSQLALKSKTIQVAQGCLLDEIPKTTQDEQESHDGSQTKNEHKNPECQKVSIDDVPNRIQFKFNGIDFYIDFTIVASGTDSDTIEGRFVYGASKTACFTNCPYKPEKCECISRCDHFEDKPLIQFSVNRHGMIQPNSKLQDEWWIESEAEEAKNPLLDLHFRALDAIWKEALDWINEDILP